MASAGFGGAFEDAAILPVPNSDLVLVKNLDVFTPIVDDPRIMGEIAACNVTNDLFAMNVLDISGMLVFLAIKTDTPLTIAQGVLEGIKDFMEKKVDSKVVGGHTIYSEWPLIGGEASGFVEKNKIIPKTGVKKGDKLILTKPIGVQALSAAYRLLKDMPEALAQYSRGELESSINMAIKLMTETNRPVVKTIHSYDDFSFIHAMSDVTGFGLAGHLKEMLHPFQLSAIIEKIPSIKFARELSDEFGYAYMDCLCAETAGGMLISLDAEKVEDFSNGLTSNGVKNWIIGAIDMESPGNVRISEKAEHLEVTHY